MSNPRALRAYPAGVIDRSAGRRRTNITLPELVIREYPDPSFVETAESFSRFHHDDVPAMDLDTLHRERARARLRWTYDPRPSDWLLERIDVLDREAARRRKKPR